MWDVHSLQLAFGMGSLTKEDQKIKLLTKWQNWWVRGREEQKFHCDLLLAPGEFVVIYTQQTTTSTSAYSQTIGSKNEFTKVHLAASWEHRETEFVEGECE